MMEALLVAIALSCGDDISCADCKDETCDKYSWDSSITNRTLLRKNGAIVGQWHEGAYYPWDGKKNGAATHPPINPPIKGAQAVHPDFKLWCKTGVGPISKKEQYTHSGKHLDANKVEAAFADTLTDDSAKGYMIIIAADKAKRDAVYAEYLKLPADFQDRYKVWIQPPNHFSMLDRDTQKPRFFTEGDPSIILEQSDGTVLFRRPQHGLHYVAADFKDLLKSDPNYQPAADPGAVVTPSPTVTPVVALLKQIPVPAYVSVGVLALAFFFRRK